MAIGTSDLSLVTSANLTSVGEWVDIVAIVSVVRQHRNLDFGPSQQVFHVLSKMVDKPAKNINLFL